MQRIVIYQQAGRAQKKIEWIQQVGQELEIVQVESLPMLDEPIIDEPEIHLPRPRGDLVLSYLAHPDLIDGLIQLCHRERIPLIVSGRKVLGRKVHNPATCCALRRTFDLGAYAAQFGLPELEVEVCQNRVDGIVVHRGSPCGATWQAAQKVVGYSVDKACERFGLEVQLQCQADPANWDPIYGKSPVHYAGKLHANALHRALKKNDDKE